MWLRQLFRENLKNCRKQAGLTQEKLAELCDTDPGYIRQIESGRRFPSIEYIERIATAFNIAPYRLFYEKSDTPDEIREAHSEEQKQKIKTMLLDNVTKICSILDE